MKKKLLAGILVVTMVISLGIVAFADQFSTIDGFGSQFVTGDAKVEVRAMMYDVREGNLVVYVKVTNTSTTENLEFDDNELRLYHDDSLEATKTSWTTGVIDSGGTNYEELQLELAIAALETQFSLAADVSITPTP